MPNYKMDIKGDLGVREYSNIFDYMGVVDSKDTFTITLEQSKKEDLNTITSILKGNNFEIVNEGLKNDGAYYINANKE
ncbi:hypothetical protein [Clostridium gasigenes]|uniref:Uncharacterized protein n=1 Tax=Clostridium gasigenes TaxID=94869 RepID=A0A1H0W1C8_9CLOT|nr:hypothetical protein [Clostridium gasigenes]MBB6625610.1 hypothetical protein [Clostridium gasigenes]MBB6716850.1 hypothetical protein [Clostridium gasigenes]MBU3106172.1 hypothetical protein [Clostridium gasigenes]MBU3109875.1 hypothetical protein [Clostridium gasigenes]MBU3134556.1 hypothetical protein [Clostridium gasigenes]